jgi:septal ring factor EnvC (AmiA/AmiB activator)
MIEAKTSQVSAPTPTHVATPNEEREQREHANKSSGIRAACFILAVLAGILGFMLFQANSALSDTKTQLAQAKSDSAQAKADLGKATAQSADLQTQLGKANARSTDLQAQLRKSQGQLSDLQARLEKARSQQSDLQGQLDAAKTQTAGLQTRIGDADNRTAELRRELDSAKAQTADLQSQLARAKSDIARLQPIATKASAMPIATAFKKGFFSSGFTLHITNRNPDPLKVNVAIAGSTKTPPKSATIESGATYDVDDLPAGANVVITSDGYDPVNLTVR